MSRLFHRVQDEASECLNVAFPGARSDQITITYVNTMYGIKRKLASTDLGVMFVHEPGVGRRKMENGCFVKRNPLGFQPLPL